jgi:YidC/Oxa1 family membrane protein insertase
MKIFSTITMILLLISPPAGASNAAACADLHSPFNRDLAAWAESSPDVITFLLTCDDGLLTLRAVASEVTTLTYNPQLELLAEPQRFYGLAAYYNQVEDIEIQSSDGAAWQGWKGRFAAVLVKPEEGRVVISGNSIELTPGVNGNVIMQFGLIDASGQGAFGGVESRDLRYAHLWGWLRGLCLFLEGILTGIQSIAGLSWGLSIILLSVMIKVALIPVTMFVAKQQRRVGSIQSALEQPLQEIKANCDGQEAHERIMAAHKDLGVSPFYTLKPMLGMFIQVPILVAVFNMLGELPLLSGQTFWWMSDLAYPDAVLSFMESGRGIPFFGSTLNLLPILMTVVTIGSAILYRDHVAPASETRKQKRNLYLMAIAFFVLFYPFPSSMVLYWATANVLQVVQQLVTKK